MARDRVLSAGPPAPNDDPNRSTVKKSLADEALRPTRLKDVVGQRGVVERLEITVDAARKRKEGLPHLLFDGPPGVGKTTLATVLPNEIGAKVTYTSGPALNSPKEILPFLTNMG